MQGVPLLVDLERKGALRRFSITEDYLSDDLRLEGQLTPNDLCCRVFFFLINFERIAGENSPAQHLLIYSLAVELHKQILMLLRMAKKKPSAFPVQMIRVRYLVCLVIVLIGDIYLDELGTETLFFLGITDRDGVDQNV